MRVRALQEGFPLARGCLVLPFLHPRAASTLAPYLCLPEMKCDPPSSPTPTACLDFAAMNQARWRHVPSNPLLPLVLKRTNATTKLITPCPPQSCLCHSMSCPGWRSLCRLGRHAAASALPMRLLHHVCHHRTSQGLSQY